jgi:hypothetical protein
MKAGGKEDVSRPTVPDLFGERAGATLFFPAETID